MLSIRTVEPSRAQLKILLFKTQFTMLVDLKTKFSGGAETYRKYNTHNTCTQWHTPGCCRTADGPQCVRLHHSNSLFPPAWRNSESHLFQFSFSTTLLSYKKSKTNSVCVETVATVTVVLHHDHHITSCRFSLKHRIVLHSVFIATFQHWTDILDFCLTGDLCLSNSEMENHKY